MDLLDTEGFARKYDFLYLPIDFKSRACLGYAFINLVDSADVQRFWGRFDGYSKWVLPSKKVCHVSWSGPHQGLESHIERYRNSPVMHKSVPDEYKPVVFRDGVRVVFPSPTKTPRAPRIRHMSEFRAATPFQAANFMAPILC
uniref:Mei2-like C-terminal RNA recognition motif domain-containing protein n=1 Tax=Alexandrium andersonii TaxID=327968 RepID=A0A7S2DTM2_9DINO